MAVQTDTVPSVHRMRRRELPARDARRAEQRRRVRADRAFAIGTRHMDGLPWSLMVGQEPGDAAQAWLYHSEKSSIIGGIKLGRRAVEVYRNWSLSGRSKAWRLRDYLSAPALTGQPGSALQARALG